MLDAPFQFLEPGFEFRLDSYPVSMVVWSLPRSFASVTTLPVTNSLSLSFPERVLSSEID
jgi:hypothetical protein